MNSWSDPGCGMNCSATVNETEASFTIQNTDPAKTYVVGLRAGNDNGWSDWVNSASAVPPNPPPATPSAVTVTRSDRTLTASWDAPAGSPTKYHVTYTANGGNTWTAAPCGVNCTSTSITISGVDNNKTYVVGVRAGNDTGWSDWRNSAPAEPFLTPPDPPTNLRIQRICDHNFQVWWDHMPRATGYDLNISGNKRKSWQRLATNSDKNGWVASWWEKERRYFFAVRAVNSAGASAWVNSGASYAPPCEPGNLKAITATTHGRAGGSIVTTWDGAKRAHAYNVNYRPSGGQWERIQSNVTNTSHTGEVDSTGSYTVAVQSTKDNGMSQWRNVNVSAWLTASNVTGGGATLNLAGHSGNWYVKKTAPTPAGVCSAVTSGTTATASGLTANTTHTITAYGDSNCANALAQTTFTTGAATLTSSNVTTTGATLTIAGNSGSWYYQANKAPDNTCQGPVSAATKDLTGLAAGTSYTYTAYSDSTCTAANRIATAEAFTTAAGLTVSNIADTTATLTLAGHSGNWYYKATSGPDSSCSSNAVSTSSVNLTGLTAGNSYTYSAYSDSTCTTANKLATATAFTTALSVSNLNKSVGNSHLFVGVNSNADQDSAVSFRTGNNANVGSYTLHSVSAKFTGGQGNPGAFSFTLHAPDTNDNTKPAATAIANATFNGNNPSTSSTSTVTHTCSGVGCQLAKNTTYFVVASAAAASGSHYYYWQSVSETTETKVPSDNGWSIGNEGLNKLIQTWIKNTQPAAIKVAATENPPATLTASGISGTGATLTIANHVGTWYYQGISGTSASTTCVTISSGTTADTLTNLTANNLYGYTAYSGANCTTAIATEYFSTTDYDVGNLAETASSGNCLVGYSGGSRKCAQSFTTGSRTGGYTLKKIAARFSNKVDSPGNIIVAVHAADTTDSANPAATAKVTLNGSDPDTAGLYTYTCTGSDCSLAKDTKYFVVMSTADTSGSKFYRARLTASDAEAVHPSSNGWSIADVGRGKNGSNAWADHASSQTGLLHIAADD